MHSTRQLAHWTVCMCVFYCLLLWTVNAYFIWNVTCVIIVNELWINIFWQANKKSHSFVFRYRKNLFPVILECTHSILLQSHFCLLVFSLFLCLPPSLVRDKHKRWSPHIAPLSDHLNLTNEMVPLTMPPVLHNAGTSVNSMTWPKSHHTLFQLS